MISTGRERLRFSTGQWSDTDRPKAHNAEAARTDEQQHHPGAAAALLCEDPLPFFLPLPELPVDGFDRDAEPTPRTHPLRLGQRMNSPC